MRTISERFFLFILMLFSLAGCRKDTSPSWDVDMFMPLVKTSLTIQDIIPDSLLQVENDHTLTLVYKNPIYNFDIDSLVQVPDTISNKFYPAIPGTVVNPGQTIYPASNHQETFNFNGADVTRIDLRQGRIKIEFVNTLQEEVIFNYKIVSATKNGQCFEITETVPAATDQPYHYLKSFDISGFSLDLTGLSHLSSNHLVTSSSAMLSPYGNAVTLGFEDYFDLIVMFEEVGIDYARGYFAQQEYEYGPATSQLKTFSNINSGSIDFESIRMSLYIENGFGIDAAIKFREITAINTKTGNEISLNSPIIGQTINIGRAIETFNGISPVTPTKYIFNLDNSNILSMIENMPNQIRYAVDLVSNPMGNISAGNDFVYYGNYLNTYLDMEIPLSLIASDLCIGDTVDFNLGEPDNSRHINGGELVLIAYNGFPFDAELAMIALDENGSIVDILIDQQHIKEALLNSDGFAEQPLRSEIRIPLSRDRLNMLYTAKRLLITAKFNTALAGSEYIKIYDTYKLDLKVTAKFNYELE